MDALNLMKPLLDEVEQVGMSQIFGGACDPLDVHNNGEICDAINSGKLCDVINAGGKCLLINQKGSCKVTNTLVGCTA